MTDQELLLSLQKTARPTELARRSAWPNVIAITGDWLILGVAIAVLIMAPIWAHPFLLFFIASRQHGLLALMHDGSHRTLFPHRALNDLASDIFCAFPFLISTAGYRANHIAHHEHLNTAQDPDLIRKLGTDHTHEEWLFPQETEHFARLLMRDVAGLSVWRMIREMRGLSGARMDDGLDRRRPAATPEYPYPAAVRIAFYASVALALWLWVPHALMVAYGWFVPLFFVLPAILRLRAVAEHFAMRRTNLLNSSRNVMAPAWERFLLAPHGVNMHLAHHLFPYVPWYRLGELHDRLHAAPEYAECRNADSYLFGPRSLLAEIRSVQDDPRGRLAPQTLTAKAGSR